MNDTTLFERHSDSFTSNIGLYYCGKRIETKNHVYGPEIRSHYLIVFVEKGKATLYRNKQKISCVQICAYTTLTKAFKEV